MILRLAAVWLVLSVLIGGLVHYFGNARLDNHVVNMAETEAANYSAEFTTYLGLPSRQTLALLNRKIHDIFDRGNFIVVEFFFRSAGILPAFQGDVSLELVTSKPYSGINPPETRAGCPRS